MNGDADNCRPQDASVEQVPILKYIDDGTVGTFYRFDALYCLVDVRIEHLSSSIDARNSVACQRVPELLPNQRHSLAIFLVGRILVRMERAIKRIENGDQFRDQALNSPATLFMLVALDPLPIIFEVRLSADKQLLQIILLGAELGDLCGERGITSRLRGL